MIFQVDSAAGSWVASAQGSAFPIQNLPYGVFKRGGLDEAHCGVAIGDRVLDLTRLEEAGLFAGTLIEHDPVFNKGTLNQFMGTGPRIWSEIRSRLVALLASEPVTTASGAVVETDPQLRDSKALQTDVLFDRQEAKMLMPARIGSFVDFYSSKEHASNVGAMFRDPDNPLLPNWSWIPIGYNGRASSVILSGEDVVRPNGQLPGADGGDPTFGSCRLLDIELEMGFFVGPGNELGHPIKRETAHKHIFGMVLVNDWSARDIQRWEYVPLGPFLGKSFATSISPWVVSMDALQPFRVPQPKQDPAPLPYLAVEGDWGLDIQLEAAIQTPEMDAAKRISATNFKYMYWTIVQQLVHLASNGCNTQPGDLYGSGTVSGPTPDSYGSLLELCWKGTKPIDLGNGITRKFLQDGDRVTLSGHCQAESFKVGFGEVTAAILPAIGS